MKTQYVKKQLVVFYKKMGNNPHLLNKTCKIKPKTDKKQSSNDPNSRSTFAK